MGHGIEGVKKLDELMLTTASEIVTELQYGDAIYTWQTYVRELELNEFKPYLLNQHLTWFSIF